MSTPAEHSTITAEPLSGSDAQMLIARLNDELTERYPTPQDRHFELADAHVSGDRGVFLVARLDGDPVGCGALRRLDDVTGGSSACTWSRTLGDMAWAARCLPSWSTMPAGWVCGTWCSRRAIASTKPPGCTSGQASPGSPASASTRGRRASAWRRRSTEGCPAGRVRRESAGAAAELRGRSGSSGDG